jgi:riboflavin synthase
MFTGLIETTGTVLCVTPNAGVTRITIAAPAPLVSRLNTGDSVAVSGVCLTALDIEPNAFPARFSADLAAETISRTTLSRLHAETVVNLELPTPAGSPLGGHVVQGHVDSTATLVSLKPLTADTETTDYRLRFTIPDALTRYVVEKGSITVEGISLTVAAIRDNEVEIAIIPHTFRATNLRTLVPGDSLNIEVDVLGKYAERQGERPAGFELSEQYLIANGY